MKILATFDQKDYQDTVAVYEKYTVRAILERDGKIAMQRGSDGEYKLPGGGMEPGEGYVQALAREVREETGLCIIEESVAELGEILEARRDIFDGTKKYVCHSLFFYCRAGEERVPLSLTPSEVAKGYLPVFVTPEEVLSRNEQGMRDPWIKRDTAFVRMIVEGKVLLPSGLGRP